MGATSPHSWHHSDTMTRVTSTKFLKHFFKIKGHLDYHTVHVPITGGMSECVCGSGGERYIHSYENRLELDDLVSKYSHESVVDESPFPRSLQHVVEIVLEAAVARVPAAALPVVGERLPQQAEPRAQLPLHSHRTCTGPSLRRAAHRPPPGLHIVQEVFLHAASRWALLPEPRAPVAISGVPPQHGITSAGRWKPGRHSHVARRSLADGSLAAQTFSMNASQKGNQWVKIWMSNLLSSCHAAAVLRATFPFGHFDHLRKGLASVGL